MKVCFKIIIIIFLTSLIFISCNIAKHTLKNQNNYVENVKVQDNVTVLATDDEILSYDNNLVYCATFQLAWNELKDRFFKGDIILKEGNSMVYNLNNSKISKNIINEKSYIADTGYKKDKVIERINKRLKKKFGEAPRLDEDMLKNEDDILAYAYMEKNLKFKVPFQEIKEGYNFNNGDNKVSFFGIENYNNKYIKLKEQLEIYNNEKFDEEAIVKLKLDNNDEIILAKIKPKYTLKESYEYVYEVISKSKPNKLDDGNKIMIPKIDFKIENSFKELEGKEITNKGFENYFISKAIQNINFKLNEKGSELQSDAQIIIQKTSIPMGNIIFNEPFLLILKEKGSKVPYFLLWIFNDEILVKK